MNNKFIYLINQEDTQYYKIGITKKDPQLRLEELQIGNAENLKLIFHFETKFSFKLETALHKHFKSERKKSEWFELTKEQVDSFLKTCEFFENTFTYLKNNSTLKKFIF